MILPELFTVRGLLFWVVHFSLFCDTFQSIEYILQASPPTDRGNPWGWPTASIFFAGADHPFLRSSTRESLDAQAGNSQQSPGRYETIFETGMASRVNCAQLSGHCTPGEFYCGSTFAQQNKYCPVNPKQLYRCAETATLQEDVLCPNGCTNGLCHCELEERYCDFEMRGGWSTVANGLYICESTIEIRLKRRCNQGCLIENNRSKCKIEKCSAGSVYSGHELVRRGFDESMYPERKYFYCNENGKSATEGTYRQ